MPYRRTENVVRRLAEREQTIVDAARSAAASGGMSAVQIAEVAERAGIASGTVYRYFPSKSDLVSELIGAVTERALDAMRDAADAAPGPLSALAASIATFSSRVLAERRLAWAAIAEPVEREVHKYRKYAWPFLPIRFLNLLPLSHMFGQSMATNIPPLIDGTVVFMHSFNPHDIVRRVREWRISVIVCVPKILDVLKEHARRIDPGAADPPKGLSIPARWWRYRKVHRMFGLKFWAFIVGAAPLGAALEDYWKRLGFVVIQGYGLTETAPIVTMNHPFKTNTGSVGKPIAGVEVKIADDGEILVRGDNVTTGYYEQPSDQPSASSLQPSENAEGRRLQADGWLHTGDIGKLDEDGYLTVVDRKKEIIISAAGKNMSPANIEQAIKGESSLIGQIVCIGDGKRYNTVLVTLDPDTASGLAKADAETEVENAIKTVNAHLARHETIKRFAVLEHDFSVEDGLLTASLKPRRREIEKRYADVLDGLY